jgi:YVTN family beta-propeller protein
VGRSTSALAAVGVLGTGALMASCAQASASHVTCGAGTVESDGTCVAEGSTGVGGNGATTGETSMTSHGDPASSGGSASGAGSSSGGHADASSASSAGASGSSSGASGSSSTGGATGCGTGAGGISGTTLILIPIVGTLGDILIDHCSTHVYVSNTSKNRIEDYSLTTGTLEAPIPVGSEPFGFDITPDGSRLYVANMGGTNLSVVDLASHTEIEKITVSPGVISDRPYSLAISADGKAIFSTTFAGSGYGGRIVSLDLATEVPTTLAGTTESTLLKASADHSTVGIAVGGSTAGEIKIYRAATSAIASSTSLGTFVNAVAMSPDGNVALVDGRLVLDTSLNLGGTIPGGGWGAVVASATRAYRSTGAEIEIVDLAQYLVTGTISAGVDMNQPGAYVSGKMALSSDGTLLAAITDKGVVLIPVP